jgi:hypothetical protein
VAVAAALSAYVRSHVLNATKTYSHVGDDVGHAGGSFLAFGRAGISHALQRDVASISKRTNGACAAIPDCESRNRRINLSAFSYIGSIEWVNPQQKSRAGPYYSKGRQKWMRTA